MRAIIVVLLLIGVVGSVSAETRPHEAEVSAAPAPPMALKTGKERLGEKATDEQRVDDCKVPPGKRTRARPTACPWDVESRSGAGIGPSEA